MLLSKYNLKNINATDVSVPDASLFDLPEKVLQFGTGVLLRGLPDYFIDKANKQGIFNGRIVVVKSTDGGDASAFEKQDGLYTVCVRGIENGKKYEEDIINASISRVLSARSEWNKVLECAHNPQLKIIISNTTEVGIQLMHDDIRRHPPVSYPGKLLAFLYERYKAFQGSQQSGMVIVPTELIIDNGKKLESIVIELAHLNGLDESFIDWLENANRFCNSLVDRIVPGRPEDELKNTIEKKLGYSDELLMMSEVYRLWAIEGDTEVADVLSFAQVDKGVVISKDINLYRELKLRLLNGTHTLSSGVAFLSGLDTVKKAMDDLQMQHYISALMQSEIAVAIPYDTTAEQTKTFGENCLDRFRNPYINHQWLSITMQYSSKMRMRVVPVLINYYSLFNTVPENMATGFAAYIYFMKAVKEENGNYYGRLQEKFYPIQDDRAQYFFEKWQRVKPALMAVSVLRDTALWGQDLTMLPGFAGAVQEKINEIEELGMAAVLDPLQSNKSIA
ncbi:MAG: tagaturonate reductase [Chitinophagaceae bacterium]|nr:tagaturonate reductase [Chitinophagaceae bacterium]